MRSESTIHEGNFMQQNISYGLRHGDGAQLPKVRTTSFRVEFIAYFGNKLWKNLPQEIKQSNSLPSSKNKLDVGMVENATVGFVKYISRKLGF